MPYKERKGDRFEPGVKIGEVTLTGGSLAIKINRERRRHLSRFRGAAETKFRINAQS